MITTWLIFCRPLVCANDGDAEVASTSQATTASIRMPRIVADHLTVTTLTVSAREHVAHATHRLDARRRRGLGFDLAAQPAHVNVHGAGVACRFVAPHGSQQALTTQDLRGVSEKVREQ